MLTRNQIITNYLIYVDVNFEVATYRFYDSHLRCIYDYFQEKEITQTTLLEYIAYSRKNGISNKTINKRIFALRRAYAYAEIECKPLEKFKSLKEKDRRFDVLTEEECTKLLDYIENAKISLQNRLILRLMYDTGIRLSELLHICIVDINFKERTIYLRHTKTNRNRLVVIRKTTRELLGKFVDFRINQVGGFFDDSTRLFTINKSGVQAIFYRAKKTLGFEKFHAHMMRHTFATFLVRKNVSLELVRNALGHSNFEMTKRYLHQNIDDLKLQLEKIDNDF